LAAGVAGDNREIIMGRVYSVAVTAVATAAAIKDMVELRAAAEKPIAIHAFYMGQSSDVQDANEEILDIRHLLINGTEVSGTGGTTPTPLPMNSSYAAASTGADANNTTVATGTLNDIHTDTWNIRVPYQIIWTPETRPIIHNGEFYVVRISAPADALTMSWVCYFEEL
jgi:hypothetical protein